MLLVLLSTICDAATLTGKYHYSVSDFLGGLHESMGGILLASPTTVRTD